VKTNRIYLEHLRAKSLHVKIGLGETFKGVFTTVLNRRGRRGDVVDVIEIDSADWGEIFDLGWVAGQDLTDLVDDCITSGTKGPDNFKLDGRGGEIVVPILITCRNG
jgi:hypothetical protein